MKLVVKYTAVDPYYSDQIQTYIGASPEEVESIRQETEDFMAKEHGGVLSMIYKAETILDTTMEDKIW